MKKFTIQELLQSQFGLEKESLRVDWNGKIVNTKHPLINKFNHRYIKVDFGEQQVELISNPQPTIKAAIAEIKILTKILYQNMAIGEYLWNYSMPLGPFLASKIASSKLLKDHQEINYRQYLSKKSSIEMQLISGIHFNWSLNPKIANQFSTTEINAFYFDIFQKYQKANFVIKQIFGASPTKDFLTFDKISYRQSDQGYQNKAFSEKQQSWTSYAHYCDDINNLIKQKLIKNWKETYGPIRIKPFNTKRIEWLEIRNFDLDFTNAYGINETALDFSHKFLLFLSQNQPIFEFKWLVNNFLAWLKKNQIEHQKIATVIANYFANKKVSKPKIKTIIGLQQQIRKQAQEINYPELADFELSTQTLLREAYLQGKKIEIIDQAKNIIKIEDVELKQATLNPFDNLKGLEIIDSKVLTNKFLKENNWACTKQRHFTNIEKAIATFEQVKNQKIVIKPVKTNFSHGITIFNFLFDQAQFIKAIEYAFSFDDEILIEDFVSGQEYRLLVINQKFVGALKRIPANVKGDGKSTIKELIAEKNKHPFRGSNYQLPLEKIVIDPIVEAYLASQNLSLTSIIPANKQIFLRQNSNISSGGDTIDVTDKILVKYQKLVETITKKLKLEICGFDIIIPNLKDFHNYIILELNWNPAIHIHTFPLIGKNQHPAKFIIKMIEKNNKKTH